MTGLIPWCRGPKPKSANPKGKNKNYLIFWLGETKFSKAHHTNPGRVVYGPGSSEVEAYKTSYSASVGGTDFLGYWHAADTASMRACYWVLGSAQVPKPCTPGKP